MSFLHDETFYDDVNENEKALALLNSIWVEPDKIHQRLLTGVESNKILEDMWLYTNPFDVVFGPKEEKK